MKALQEVVFKALEGDADSEQELIKVCSGFALAYLRQRTKKDTYLFSLISGSLKSLALDCIAELFGKKEGKLVVLSQYFSSFEDSNKTESEFHTHLRRLVFSKVNETIYGYYKAFDPSLGKVIRNLKRVMSEDKPKGLVYKREKRCIVLGKKEKGLPLMAPELLEIRLATHFKDCKNTKEVLEAIRIISDRYPEYQISIHITSLAQIIRKLYQFYNEIEGEEVIQNHSTLATTELHTIIRERMEKAKLDLYPSYVAKSKIPVEDFSKYFMVVEQILKNEYVLGNGNSHYDSFKEVIDGVSKKEYREKHRKYVEYFVKHSRSDLISYLKKNNKVGK